MRVHIGCDHAGLDLKAHLVAWLTEHGHEPVDHGPFVYDALDDYPVFCLRAAEGSLAGRRPGSLGVVIGGSGNGEQMAANKVRGIRAALVWSEETAELARQHNDANVVIAVGGRMHSVDEMTRFVEVFLATPFSQEERHARRIGMLSDYETTGELPPLPASARVRAGPMPEGHTLHRLARDLQTAFGGRVVRASSPQGRFEQSAALVDGTALVRAESAGKHLFAEFEAERVLHVHLGLIGSFDVHTGVSAVPAPVGQVRLRLTSADAYADLRGAILCDLVTPERRDEIVARLGPDPLRPDADPMRAWRRISRSGRPIGDLLMDQEVLAGVGNVYRAEVLFRHRMHPLRPGRTLRIGQWRAMWDDLVGLMAEGVRTGTHRHGAARAHAGGDGARRRGRTTTVARSTSTAAPASRAWCAGPGSAPRVLVGRNLFWCPRCQPRFRSRAVQ